MSKDELLSRVRALADPLRLIAAIWLVLAVLAPIQILARHKDAGWGALGVFCFLLGLLLLIAPAGRPNAIFLRAFRNDASSAAPRGRLSATLGPEFRLAGIRPPRERTSVFLRFLMPGLLVLRYTGSKFMELEAGDDWIARLWKTCAGARIAFIDLRDVSTHLQQEITLMMSSVGAARTVFLVDQGCRGDARRVVREFGGPGSDPDKAQVLEVGPTRPQSGQLQADLKDIVARLPAGAAGESAAGRQFVLDHVGEEILRRSGDRWAARIAAAAALILPPFALAAFWALVPLEPEDAGDVRLLYGIAVFTFTLVVAGRALHLACKRAWLLGRADHREAASRAWLGVLLAASLLFTLPVSFIVQTRPLVDRAVELTARAQVELLRNAETLYRIDHPAFACDVQTLRDAGAVSTEIASKILSNPDYRIQLACKWKLLHTVVSGYAISAAPSDSEHRKAYCADESGQVLEIPPGGRRCADLMH